MHVVLSGYYGFDNVGDEAILFSIINALKNLQPEIEITVLSNKPESTRETYKVNAVNRRNIKEIARAIKKADGLISGGGSLMQDRTGIKSIPYYAGIIKLAKLHKKPVFIYAQGMGPMRRSLSKWIVKHTLNKVENITVRDQDSRGLLKEIGVKQLSSIVPDPVLGLDSSNFINNWKKAHNLEKPIITVSVRKWETNTPYKKRIAKCLDQLVQQGNTVVFVPMHGKQDEETSKETAALMQEKSLISPADASIEQKIALIGESKLLIGMRLHSLIFSAVTYTPFAALSYDPKIDAFASICEQPVAGHVEKEDWDEHTLFEIVTNSMDDVSQQDKLKTKVREYRKQARTTPELALQTFKTGTVPTTINVLK